MTEYIEREKVDNWLLTESASLDTQVDREDVVERLREAIPAADVRPVVTCSRCYWWTKQEDSVQGRCALSGSYPAGGWFCANGRLGAPEDEG